MEPPGRFEYEYGDKIILPEGAFGEIKRLRLPFPLTFEVFNDKKKRPTGMPDRTGAAKQHIRQFSGVLEFTAPDDQAYLPNWMMSNLLISEGGRVFVKSVMKVCVVSDNDTR